MAREEEVKKQGAKGRLDDETASLAQRERAAAVKALKDEKNTLYNECKSALGEEEAKLQIQQFMVSCKRIRPSHASSLRTGHHLQEANEGDKRHLRRRIAFNFGCSVKKFSLKREKTAR